MYNVCQNLYKNCTIILLDYSSQQNFLFIANDHVLKDYQFTFPQYTRIQYTKLMYFICLANYLAVWVVLISCSHLFPKLLYLIHFHSLLYDHVFLIPVSTVSEKIKSRKLNEIFEAQCIELSICDQQLVIFSMNNNYQLLFKCI